MKKYSNKKLFTTFCIKHFLLSVIGAEVECPKEMGTFIPLKFKIKFIELVIKTRLIYIYSKNIQNIPT